MKTLVPLLFFTISIHALVAQTSEPVESISKGTKFIGGSFSFSTSTTDEFLKSTTFSIGPEAGFYIKDDLAVGGFLGYNYARNEQIGIDNFSSASVIGLTAFLLKNYKITNNLFFTLEPQLSLGFGKQRFSNPDFSDYSLFNFGLGVSPGVMFFVSRKFALQTTIGSLSFNHTRRSQNFDEVSKTNSFGLNGALSISSFSIRYFIW